MKKILAKSIGVIYGVMLLAIASPAVLGQELEYQSVLRHIELDQRVRALAIADKALQRFPGDGNLWYAKGLALLHSKELDAAVASFEKGIEVDEKNAMNYVGRGRACLLKNNAVDANAFFEKALALTKSKNPAVLKAIAAALIERGMEKERAMTLLEKSLAIRDIDGEAHVLMGDAYLLLFKDGGKAVSSYERAVRINASNALPHLKIAEVYTRSGNLDAAKEALIAALTADDQYTLAYKELGELYYRQKEGSKAVEAYAKYLSLTDSPGDGKLRYAFFLFMARDFEHAIKEFQELVLSGTATANTWRYFAYSLSEADRLEESNNAFQKFFTRASAEEIEASDYARYAKLLLKLGEDSLAIIQLHESLELEQRQPEIVRMLAETSFKARQYENAAAAYKMLSGIHQKYSSQDLYTLGRTYYHLRRYAEADTVFRKLISEQPNITAGYLWEARTLSNLDPESDQGLAKPYYEKVIAIASASRDKHRNDLIEAYSYLGYFYFIRNEKSLSREQWQNVITLDADNVKAKEALNAIH